MEEKRRDKQPKEEQEEQQQKQDEAQQRDEAGGPFAVAAGENGLVFLLTQLTLHLICRLISAIDPFIRANEFFPRFSALNISGQSCFELFDRIVALGDC